MYDIIEKIDNSLVHHGKNSNRIYIMSLDIKDVSRIIFKVNKLAKDNGYTKIVAKIPDKYSDIFVAEKFVKEAFIPKLYYGKNDGCFMCKYINDKRKIDGFCESNKKILEIAMNKKPVTVEPVLTNNFKCRQVNEKDVTNAVDLYKKVFKSYPFPIYEKEYILKTMKENIIYYGIWDGIKLVALSSIEMDQKHNNAEMTDFAVLNEYRGKGLAFYLLNETEKRLNELNIKTVFTIARAKSAGMNITFAKKGYTYSGTMINNTNISGQIESMNVWYKNIIALKS